MRRERGAAGIPAAPSARSRRIAPRLISYRSKPAPRHMSRRCSGSVPVATAARTCASASSLVGDSSVSSWPAECSSQYAAASMIATRNGRSSLARKARTRSTSERPGFVAMSFALRGAPCGDDADATPWRLTGHHRDQSHSVAEAHGDPTFLPFAMFVIRAHHQSRVPEGGPSLIKRDAMRPVVAPRLGLMPLSFLHGDDPNQGRFATAYQLSRR